MNTECGRAMRPASTVMRLARMGSFHQTRLSFMRQLTRRMAQEKWQFERTRFSINALGVGSAIYQASVGERAYSLVAFSHDLPADQRSDRVIAEAWDATFALFDGIPTEADIERLAKNVPLQEAGRVSAQELSLSRANRSLRLWEHVVEALAGGHQPDAMMIDEIGYLMRTTAVYGSGKFGAADRNQIADRPEMKAPFQAEMLSVYLTRWFVRDLVEHMARARGGKAAIRLDETMAKNLGIGNSTGLGMAPFLINHPRLLHAWIAAREEAIARVCALEMASPKEWETFRSIFSRAKRGVANWHSAHELQHKKLEILRTDLVAIEHRLEHIDTTEPQIWRRLTDWTKAHLSLEGQEFLLSLILEPYGALVDDLGAMMSVDESFHVIDPTMSIETLKAKIKTHYAWALEIDFDNHDAMARCWYVSAEKLEPRLGERFEEPIEDYEQPLAVALYVSRLYNDLENYDGRELGTFLAQKPEHRQIVRRLQICAALEYAEIQDNTISANLMPIDMLRAKPSFFGATRFDPRSDRWVRIAMYQGAPYPEDLTTENADDWVYPEEREVGA